MKYLVIGVGAIGTVIAKDLAQATNTTEAGLADINLEFARELADEIGGNTKAIYVDIYDENLLRKVIKDYDVVVNATGPFYKTVRYIVEAWIDYVDVADDSAAVEVNDEKEGKAVMYEYTCACEMNPATGLSASYAAQVVAHAKKKMTGIVAPEQYLEVKPYLQYLESKGFEFFVSITKDGKTSEPTLLKTEEI